MGLWQFRFVLNYTYITIRGYFNWTYAKIHIHGINRAILMNIRLFSFSLGKSRRAELGTDVINKCVVWYTFCRLWVSLSLSLSLPLSLSPLSLSPLSLSLSLCVCVCVCVCFFANSRFNSLVFLYIWTKNNMTPSLKWHLFLET